MRPIVILTALFLALGACSQSVQQEKTDLHVGGPCEGCEALFEYGERNLSSELVLQGYESKNPKIHISGRVLLPDGKTPASNVILYVYHTDENGVYPSNLSSRGWERRHGIIRGWIRTDVTGEYLIKTFRPASYPETTVTAHIHVTVKEEGLTPYYIDDFLFDDDPYLTIQERNSLQNRGGTGILTLSKVDSIYYATRDIILGLNIPDHPSS